MRSSLRLSRSILTYYAREPELALVYYTIAETRRAFIPSRPNDKDGALEVSWCVSSRTLERVSRERKMNGRERDSEAEGERERQN